MIIFLLYSLNIHQFIVNNHNNFFKSEYNRNNKSVIHDHLNPNDNTKIHNIGNMKEIKIIKSYNYSSWGSIRNYLRCYYDKFILYDSNINKYKEFSIDNGSFLNNLPRYNPLPLNIGYIRFLDSSIFAVYKELDGAIYEYQYPSFQKTNEYLVSNINFGSSAFLPIDNNFWIIQSPNPFSSEQNYYLHCINMKSGMRDYYSIYLGKNRPIALSTDNKRIYIMFEDNTINVFGKEKNEYCEIVLPINEFFIQDRIGVWDFDYDGRYFWFNERFSDTLFALDLLAIAGFDYDDDGLIDADELDIGTNPEIKDTDNDTMTDGFEIHYDLDPLDPSDANGDLDNDGLTNSQEYLFGSDPTIIDSDNDGLSDYEEYKLGCDPNNIDSDGDGLIDGEDPRPAVPIRWWELIGVSWSIVVIVTIIFSFWFRRHHYNNS